MSTDAAETKTDDKTADTNPVPTPGAATATADPTKKNDAPSTFVPVVLKAPPKCDDAGFLKLVSETKDIDKITHLHLGGDEWDKIIDCNITDKTLEFIAATFPKLVALDLQRSREITDAGVEHLSKLSRITSLDLTNCCKITDAGLQHISNLVGITSLGLSYCNITDVGLEHISKLSNMTSLNLYRCGKITDAGLEHLSTLSRITSLSLSYCKKITDAGLEHIAKLSGITFLDLVDCGEITDAGLEHLSKLSSIANLALWGCGKITQEAKSKFKTAHANCVFQG